jgi:radical SAM superfamily enzyme YgiQ (UPF0313 family)
MKVLLISANKSQIPYPVYPLGLDYVCEALCPKHQVEIIDLNVLDGIRELNTKIGQFEPDIIGVSLRNIDNTDTTDVLGFFSDYQQLLQGIRQATRAHIVLGGAGFSIFPKQAMQALEADYGIIGEGERMIALLDAIEQGAPVDHLPGVISNNGIQNFPKPWPGKFRPQFSVNADHLSFYLQKGGMLNLQTKRGCPFRCIYCTYPHIEGRRMRLIEPAQVARTALQLEQAGAKYLFISDSAFNADIEHSLAVADQFRKAGLSTAWGAFLAPMAVPPGYFTRLADAGLTHVEFGTESLSNRMLKTYGKPFDRNQIVQSHLAAVDNGLHVAHYFLLGGPGETAETLDSTLKHVEHLKKTVFFFFCGVRIYPHTQLYDRALADGQIDADQDLLTPVFYHTDAISNDDILTTVQVRSRNRINWVVGSGGEQTAQRLTRLYERGYTGPLWEYLIR